MNMLVKEVITNTSTFERIQSDSAMDLSMHSNSRTRLMHSWVLSWRLARPASRTPSPGHPAIALWSTLTSHTSLESPTAASCALQTFAR